MQPLPLILLAVCLMLGLTTTNGFYCPFGCGPVNCGNTNNGLTPYCHDIGFASCECSATKRRLDATPIIYGKT